MKGFLLVFLHPFLIMFEVIISLKEVTLCKRFIGILIGEYNRNYDR